MKKRTTMETNNPGKETEQGKLTSDLDEKFAIFHSAICASGPWPIWKIPVSETRDFFDAKEIASLYDYILDEPPIDIRRIKSLIRKLDKDKLHKTKKLNNELFSIIYLVGYVEKQPITGKNILSSWSKIIPLDKNFTPSWPDLDEFLRKMEADKNNLSCGPIWCTYFLMKALTNRLHVNSKWQTVITLLWTKRFMQEYCKIPYRFPFLRGLVDNIDFVKKFAKEEDIDSLCSLLTRNITASYYELHPKERTIEYAMDEFYKKKQHAEGTQSKLNQLWENTEMNRILSEPILCCTDGQNENIKEILSHAYWGLHLKYRACAKEFDNKFASWFSSKNQFDLADFLNDIFVGASTYQEWVDEEQGLKGSQKKKSMNSKTKLPSE